MAQFAAAFASGVCLCVVVSWACASQLRLKIKRWNRPGRSPREWDLPQTGEKHTKDLGHYAREVGMDIEEDVAITDDGFYLRMHKVVNPKQEDLGNGRGPNPVLLVSGETRV